VSVDLSFDAAIQRIGYLMTNLILLVIVGTTIWLGFDANQRDWRRSSFARNAAIWVVGSLAMWIVVFPLYLFMRQRAPLKSHG
jgi:heme/copper-type cytochrome/quinol oxidase subunit 4